MRQSLTGKYNVTEYDGTATEGQLRQMYKAGISEMSARKGVTRIGVKSVTDGDHRHALTQLSVLDEFARKHGLSIVCVDTLYDETGAEINGEYRTGNNIVISLDADGGLYMPVVGHEVFHYAESIDTEQAGVLTQMVIDTLEQTKGAEWLADRRAEYGKQYDKSEVDSEIAADFFGAAITQKEFSNYIRSAKMNKSFTKKIVNKIKQIVADLRGIMQKLRGQRLIYDATLDLDAETLDFFTDSIETILSQAGTEQAETSDSGKVRKMYAGEKAKTADNSMLEEAKKRIENGEDAEAVRKSTGWFKGYDGKWRFEIDDSQMKFHRDGDARLMKEKDYRRLVKLTDLWAQTFENGKEMNDAQIREMENLQEKYSDAVWSEKYLLSDFVKHDELFKAYPELNHVNLVFESLSDRAMGYFDKRTNTIVLSDTLFGKESEVVLHEGVLHSYRGFSQTF